MRPCVHTRVEVSYLRRTAVDLLQLYVYGTYQSIFTWLQFKTVCVTLSFRDLCLSCTSVYGDILTFPWAMYSCKVPAVPALHYLFRICRYLFIVQIYMLHYLFQTRPNRPCPQYRRYGFSCGMATAVLTVRLKLNIPGHHPKTSGFDVSEGRF